MLVSSRTKEIIMFSAQLKECTCPLALKAPHHMLHYSYSGVMSPSDGAHQSTAFQLGEALMNFIASIQSKKQRNDYLHKQALLIVNQAARWFSFDRQATLWHSEWTSTAISCLLPGWRQHCCHWSLICHSFPLWLALLFGLTMINSVAHSQSLHLACLYWSGQVNVNLYTSLGSN